MKYLNLEQVADYLEFATIHKTIKTAFNIVHSGESKAGVDFILINNALGESVLDEAI